jgi:hypothetical protein
MSYARRFHQDYSKTGSPALFRVLEQLADNFRGRRFWRMFAFIWLGTASICSQACAQEHPSVSCPPSYARIIDITKSPPAPNPEQPDISANVNSTAKVVRIVGPILGSMDSPLVDATLRCDGGTITLMSNIVRSASYQGATGKNILWKPEIDIQLADGVLRVHIESIWSMHLNDGREIVFDENDSEQQFPVFISRDLSFD